MSYMGDITQENISKYCENAWLTIDLTCGEFPEYFIGDGKWKSSANS